MSGSVLVICFGDSLTAGFQSPTRENPAGGETPYGDFLQQALGESAEVRISGICGELTGDMVARFGRDVLSHRPSFVTILGGTNDLGWNVTPSEIMRNLVIMYEESLKAGGTPIPVTVPSIRVGAGESSREGSEWITTHLERRRQLNGLIQNYAGSKGLAWVDLFTATVDSDSGQLAERYSNDGLHLTTSGYRLVAEEVAKILMPLLWQDGRA
jgi:lysophospholipase L1-like esterase